MARRKRKLAHVRSIDLHGVRHSEAEAVVEDYVLLNKPPIEIITGNSTEMKSIVRRVLDRHGFRYIDSPAWNYGTVYVQS